MNKSQNLDFLYRFCYILTRSCEKNGRTLESSNQGAPQPKSGHTAARTVECVTLGFDGFPCPA